MFCTGNHKQQKGQFKVFMRNNLKPDYNQFSWSPAHCWIIFGTKIKSFSHPRRAEFRISYFVSGKLFFAMIDSAAISASFKKSEI